MNDTSDQTMDCKCEQCDFIDKTENGLKQHIAKKHNVIDVKNVASTALHRQTQNNIIKKNTSLLK